MAKQYRWESERSDQDSDSNTATINRYQPLDRTVTSPGFFDFGFTRFITNVLTSIFWAITVVLAILVCVSAVLVGLYGVSQGDRAAWMPILLAPVATALFLLLMRMVFELDIVVFRIETRLRTIEKNSEKMLLIEEHLRSIREHHEKK